MGSCDGSRGRSCDKSREVILFSISQSDIDTSEIFDSFESRKIFEFLGKSISVSIFLRFYSGLEVIEEIMQQVHGRPRL